jgi:hypothetical protein
MQIKLTHEQASLIASLSSTYGIDPDDVRFFDQSGTPFLGYEAMCAMINALCPEVRGIDLAVEQSPFPDAIGVRCSLTLADGRCRSAVGVANAGEKLGDEVMSPQQLHYVACSRALRLALRTAGIDLLRLHSASGMYRERKTIDVRTTLLAQVHLLGREIGILRDDDRSAWEALLEHRYGVRSSAALQQAQLADLASVLRALKSTSQAVS